MIFSSLVSQSVVTVSSGLVSKSVVTFFSGLTSKSVTTVFSGLASKSVVSFFVEPQNQGGGFPDLGLKTDSCGLVIWVLKLPRRFLGLVLKTKQVMVCRLHHKIDGRMVAWDTHRDLTTCFT
jgi:hypothetical protein